MSVPIKAQPTAQKPRGRPNASPAKTQKNKTDGRRVARKESSSSSSEVDYPSSVPDSDSDVGTNTRTKAHGGHKKRELKRKGVSADAKKELPPRSAGKKRS